MAYVDEEQKIELTVTPLLGLNTASAPTQLTKGQWRYMRNAYQTKLGAIAKRPGSVSVTNTPLSAPAERLMVYRTGTAEKLLASSGTGLYKYTGTDWAALTGVLTSANVYDIDFTDDLLNSRKVMADGGKLKAYRDDTETVYEIVPAADDPYPAPPNYLDSLTNTKYVFAYSGHLFLSDGKDTWYYLKRNEMDYLPSVQFERWVRENDYITGPGMAFDNVCLMPMRRGWGILVGSTFDDFAGNLFLNTTRGVIAPRSPQRVTYPNGDQTIVYLSDDGVHEIYDTGFQDTGSRRYSTRSLMSDKIDFDALGLTDSEKQEAVGYFDTKIGLYLLKVNHGADKWIFVFDTRNREWYMWDSVSVNSFLRTTELYFVGGNGHLSKFDPLLGSDWADKAKTTGTPVVEWLATDMIALDDNGYASYLDYLLIMAKQFNSKSTLDVKVVLYQSTVDIENALRNQFMVWNVTEWNEGVWANLDFTDTVGVPPRLILKKRSYYFQIWFKNEEDELTEIYQYKLIGRVVG